MAEIKLERLLLPLAFAGCTEITGIPPPDFPIGRCSLTDFLYINEERGRQIGPELQGNFTIEVVPSGINRADFVSRGEHSDRLEEGLRAYSGHYPPRGSESGIADMGYMTLIPAGFYAGTIKREADGISFNFDERTSTYVPEFISFGLWHVENGSPNSLVAHWAESTLTSSGYYLRTTLDQRFRCQR